MHLTKLKVLSIELIHPGKSTAVLESILREVEQHCASDTHPSELQLGVSRPFLCKLPAWDEMLSAQQRFDTVVIQRVLRPESERPYYHVFLEYEKADRWNDENWSKIVQRMPRLVESGKLKRYRSDL